MKPLFLLALWPISLLTVNMVHGGDFSSSARGTTAAQFLKLGAGARAVAMGEAYSAVADEASALYWNPAALTQIPGHALTFMHAPYIEFSFYDYAAYAQNLGTWGSVGIGGQFLSMGNITQSDALGNDIGSFNPNDMAISLGYARSFGKISLGLSGKFIRSTILNTAQTQAVDIGLLSPEFCNDRLRLSLVAANLGGRIKFEQEGAELPQLLRAGSRLKFSDSFISSLEGVFPKDNAPYMALGTEYGLLFSERKKISGFLRTGFNTRTLNDLGFNGISLGMGLGFGNISLDYAFLSMGALGLTHRFSLSLKWDKAETPRTYSRASATNLSFEKFSASILPDQSHYARRKVLFQYQNKDAHTVELIGNFNNWTPELMSRREEGLWILTKDMPDGVYYYNFRVDGQEITDPRNKNVTAHRHKSKIGASVFLLGATSMEIGNHEIR